MKNFKYYGVMSLVAGVGAILFSEIIEIMTGYDGYVDSVVFVSIVGFFWDSQIAPIFGLRREY